ncbi:hypothetical protein [Aureivirga marina]|uniref:hypothetical protein n=1 Tax=Aureivirga marina TaxID=1182451 RepID=UPI0018C9731B|nr:hypothetical protein [Aureivirga marina]
MFEKLKTTAFIAGSFIKHGILPTRDHNFSCPNRQEFSHHLNQLNPSDAQSSAWIQHLKSVNIYCDEHNVTLSPRELSGLTETYAQSRSISVRDAMSREANIFGANASDYPQGSLAHDLRAHRPSASLFPNGKISFN